MPEALKTNKAEAQLLERSAPAKVNLFLHVTGRREDGLHELQSIFTFCTVGDCIRLSPAPRTRLDITGPFAGELAAAGGLPDGNLVTKAERLLRKAHGRDLPKVRIELEKNLPVGAGIGGGSADAAAGLKALIDYWGLVLGDAALGEIALALGADVPACLSSASSWVEGVGEDIRRLEPFPVLYGVLANPGRPLATAAVFKAFAEAGTPFSALLPPWPGGGRDSLLDFLAATRNDLEPFARALVPDIGDVLAVLAAQPKCLLARMSGSGATCFGLFEDVGAAGAAAAAISAARPDWWVEDTALGRGATGEPE